MIPHGLSLILAVYFGLNFLCALGLHVHAQKQAHLPLRALDVLVHFVLLTALALPVLLALTAGAMFGAEQRPPLGKRAAVRAA